MEKESTRYGSESHLERLKAAQVEVSPVHRRRAGQPKAGQATEQRFNFG